MNASSLLRRVAAPLPFAALAGALTLSACAADVAVVGDQKAVVGAACSDSTPCVAEAFCAQSAGATAGTCTTRPTACPELYGPVCGRDGKTYDNDCFANAGGTSVAHSGACSGGGTDGGGTDGGAPDGGGDGAACGGIAGIPCAAGFFCKFELSAACGAADQQGTCTKAPEACPAVYAPVCGCDGKTYGNDCEASGAKVSVAKAGACSAGKACGGRAGATCASTEFCKFATEDQCGAADAQGACATRPEICPAISAPVCGCDGTTYDNECLANAAGTSVVATGGCK